MLTLLLAVQPQSCSPYVHIGFKICLYKSILLCTVRVDFLPISQCIFLYLSSSAFLFFFTCTFHRRRVSRFIPKYFAVLQYGMSLLFINIGNCSVCLYAKFT